MQAILQSQPQALVKISGDNQQGASGEALTNPFVVEVRDKNGIGLAGFPVRFTVTAGGGSLSVETSTTDSNGHAQTTLTLGAVGTNTVSASVEGVSQPVTFTAVVDWLPSFGDSTVIAAQRYIIGDSIRVILPQATGGDGPLVYILWPSLPNGLRFAPTTRIISGTPRKVQPETKYTLSALDADGDVVSLTFTLKVQQQPTPDFNGDGRVDFADFLLLTAQFGLGQGAPGYDARYDLDGDGTIGFGDFLIFGRAFGREGS